MLPPYWQLVALEWGPDSKLRRVRLLLVFTSSAAILKATIRQEQMHLNITKQQLEKTIK